MSLPQQWSEKSEYPAGSYCVIQPNKMTLYEIRDSIKNNSSWTETTIVD